MGPLSVDEGLAEEERRRVRGLEGEEDLRPVVERQAEDPVAEASGDEAASGDEEVGERIDSSILFTARITLDRLEELYPGQFPDSRLRTLQRRFQKWRHEAARDLVFRERNVAGLNFS